jgi:hypothetical protein
MSRAHFRSQDDEATAHQIGVEATAVKPRAAEIASAVWAAGNHRRELQVARSRPPWDSYLEGVANVLVSVELREPPLDQQTRRLLWLVT